jgi:hypothetical protein
MRAIGIRIIANERGMKIRQRGFKMCNRALLLIGGVANERGMKIRQRGFKMCNRALLLIGGVANERRM